MKIKKRKVGRPVMSSESKRVKLSSTISGEISRTLEFYMEKYCIENRSKIVELALSEYLEKYLGEN